MTQPIWTTPDPNRFPAGLIETPRSGTMKYGERITYAQEFEGKAALVRAFADIHPRGSLWVIPYLSNLNAVFIVEDCTCQVDRGGKGTVTINYNFLGSVPPDEWAVTPFEINPPIERHPYFATLTPDDLTKARSLFTSISAQGYSAVQSAIAAATNSSLISQIVAKWLLGEETFYLAGVKYQWTSYHYSLLGIPIRAGGYRETPFGPGVAPLMQWLRQADEIVWANGLYKLTRTWVGAPTWAAYWDTDLYNTVAS